MQLRKFVIVQLRRALYDFCRSGVQLYELPDRQPAAILFEPREQPFEPVRAEVLHSLH